MHSPRTRFAVLDTSVYIENYRSGRFTFRLIQSPLIVRCSSVVLHELLRGARAPKERKYVMELARRCQILSCAGSKPGSEVDDGPCRHCRMLQAGILEVRGLDARFRTGSLPPRLSAKPIVRPSSLTTICYRNVGGDLCWRAGSTFLTVL